MLATRHGKERAIGPVFAATIGLEVFVPPQLDTDGLGTFTGDVPRAGSMREAARAKARLGLAATGLPLAIASEGSFGPHPVVPFVAGGAELLLFRDEERGLEIVEEAVSEQTNFAAADVSDLAALDLFLTRVGFPSHAVVCRVGSTILKGIRSRSQLKAFLDRSGGPLRLEADMRAHMNPTRMAEIGRLAQKLATRIATPCPACEAPGFGVVRRDGRLNCSDCGSPTLLVAHLVHGCTQCSHELFHARPDGRTHATPADCPECNP